MSSPEIKKKLHNNINQIEDETALHLLNEAAEAYATKQPDILDLLTTEQLEELRTAQQQIKEGRGISNEKIVQMSREWIREHTK